MILYGSSSGAAHIVATTPAATSPRWSMTILIVDDDADIRHLLTTFLTFRGYFPVSVANGQEAINHLRHSQPCPQLILLDQMMPVMDGTTFRHAQRQDPALADIPIVVLSGAENIEEQAPRLAAVAYLSKPIDFNALLRVVEHYDDQARQQRGSILSRRDCRGDLR
jgi:CheY-like chemotaxis protein